MLLQLVISYNHQPIAIDKHNYKIKLNLLML